MDAMTLLATLGLSAEAIAARRHSIGGSDANTIMSGDEARIIRLWQEKRGEVPGDDRPKAAGVLDDEGGR